MGFARLELRQPERALTDFEWALRWAPDDTNALRNAAVALVALGRVEAAEERIARLVELDPEDDALRGIRDRLRAGDTSDFGSTGIPR